jgi:hypothetical protein
MTRFWGHLYVINKEAGFFWRSLRLGLFTALPAALVVINMGFARFKVLNVVQPAKLG